MANEFVQTMAEARVDAKSLSEFIFKPANFMVIRRLAPPVNTLQYYIDLFENISIGGEFNSAKIESLTVSTGAAGTNASVVTGGTPSNRTFALTIPRGDTGVTGANGKDGKDGSFTQKAYSTEALMIADKASIPANTSVDVTNDPTPSKNGTYSYNGTAFTKSAYDPLNKINAVNLSASFMGGLVEGDKSSGFIYVEESTQVGNYNMYFKTTGNIWIAKVGNAASIGVTWDTVLANINRPDLVVTSPKGVENCLLINKDVLVYNNQTNKFELVLRHDVRLDVHSPLVRESYGQFVGGALYTAWVRQKLSGNNEDYQLYLAEGHLPTSIPYVEIPTTRTLTMYIKTDVFTLRKHTTIKVISWDKVVADINDPSMFVTSPKGEANCLKLKDNCLVYDIKTGTVKLNPTVTHSKDTEFLLAASLFGQLIDGALYDWWAMKKLNALDGSGGGGSSEPDTIINVTSTGSNSLPTPNTRFIAHGGMNGFMQFAPLNTAPAYRNAGEYGYWGAETDMVETKDGEWIHCHDPFLSDYIVGGTGNFIDYTLAEIKAMDATKRSAVHGWTDVPPLELSEFLEICKQYGMTPVIEFKSTPTAAGVNRVLSKINASVGQGNCVLMSFDLSVLQLVRSINTKVPLFLLTSAMTEDNIVQALDLDNCGLSVHSSSTAANIKLAREAGLEVGIWTVSQGQIDSDLAKGVDYVTTDIGVPYDFKKGVATYNFKNAADFSNLTSKGTATATNNKLTIPASSNVYLDIPVSYGDVITVSCEAKASVGGSTITIRGLNTSLATVRDYTARAIKAGNFAVHTAASVVYDKSVTSVRVLISSGSTASSIRDIKIKKYKV